MSDVYTTDTIRLVIKIGYTNNGDLILDRLSFANALADAYQKGGGDKSTFDKGGFRDKILDSLEKLGVGSKPYIGVDEITAKAVTTNHS